MTFEQVLKQMAQNKIKRNCLINPNGCWIWQRYLDKDGYGITRFDGKLYRVSRLSLWAFKNVVLSHKYSLHSCNNRACGNPEHLRTGSQRNNMEDRKLVGKYKGIYRGGRRRRS
jgi:hypothetical protein